MEFLTEQSEFSREAREEREDNIGSLFLWLVAIAVLIGLNAFSWLFCMYVFGNPEVPLNYKMLSEMKQLDPLKGFKTTEAPRGKFFNAKNLYLEHYDYSEDKLRHYNGILKRYYLKNYKEISDVKFVSGTFKVESVRELTSADVFPHGIAVRLVADGFPAAHVDYVLPTPEDAEIPSEHFRPGDVIQIQESATCAALIHVERLEEDHICFTAVPLVERKEAEGYSSLETPAGTKLAVGPPPWLNLAGAKWPISDEPELIATPVETPATEAPEPEVPKK